MQADLSNDCIWPGEFLGNVFSKFGVKLVEVNCEVAHAS